MIGEMLDSLIGVLSPASGARRSHARQVMNQVRSSYDAGKMDRLTKYWKALGQSGNNPDVAEVQRARDRGWDLYRNNAYCRKAVRACAAQVVGCGLKPESTASTVTGIARTQFREKAQALWNIAVNEMCGDPSQGGMTFDRMQAMAFVERLLSGEILFRVRAYKKEEMKKLGLRTPLRLEMIEAERLVEYDTFTKLSKKNPAIGENSSVFRGIEFDQNQNRTYYHVYRQNPNDAFPLAGNSEIDYIPAKEIIHYYWADRPNQHRGVSILTPAVRMLRDLQDYQQNELTASTVASCVTLAITRNGTAGVGAFGTAAATGESLVDDNGNRISKLQPGMIIDGLQPGEDIKSFNPARPTTSAVDWIQHILRAVAASLPGLKASTLTGDYRQSSFSSEKSADNDAWREIEQEQECLAASFCQAVWNRFIEASILAGLLPDTGDFTARPELYNSAEWHGPVAKSINPTTDEQASAMAMKNGTSSLPAEASARGMNWRQNIDATAEVYAYAKTKGLPDEYVTALLQINPSKQEKPGTPQGKGPGSKKSDEDGIPFDRSLEDTALEPAEVA